MSVFGQIKLLEQANTPFVVEWRSLVSDGGQVRDEKSLDSKGLVT
jgi:hypothetical protein